MIPPGALKGSKYFRSFAIPSRDRHTEPRP